MDKIPDKGQGIIVLYHGLTGCDIACLYSKVLLEKNRRIHIIIDNLLYKIPGAQTFFRALGLMNQNKEKCLELLQKGELVGIYPGGVKELLFSDDYYKLVWGNHKGFARLALETKSKIIPMFTKNSREIHGCIRLFSEEVVFSTYKKYGFPFGLIIWG